MRHSVYSKVLATNDFLVPLVKDKLEDFFTLAEQVVKSFLDKISKLLTTKGLEKMFSRMVLTDAIKLSV